MAETKKLPGPESTDIEEIKPLTPEEKWEKATIANNFIFYKVMRNHPDVCKELLEILLEMEIDHIEMHGEEIIETDSDSKSVRLDVYAKNDSHAFNIEMQAADTKELPERARYYQGVIDVDCLNAGQPYKKLKDSYVIFICIPDIFGKGLACYSFENLCREDNTIQLKDRAFKYFFIAKNCNKVLNERQKAFLELVTGKKASDQFTRRIEHLAEEAKHNTQWRRQYMNWERQRTYDIEKGKEEKAIEAAVKNVNKYHATPEEAAADMGAPLDKVLDALKLQPQPANV